MSGHNAALSLPPGDRDDAPSDDQAEASSPPPIAGREQELRTIIENLSALRATIRRAMEQKQRGRLWPYAGIAKDRERLEAATTTELAAEIALGTWLTEQHKEAA